MFPDVVAPMHEWVVCSLHYVKTSICLPLVRPVHIYELILLYLGDIGDPGYGILGGRPHILLKGAMHQSGPPIIRLLHVLPCQFVIKIIKCFYCLHRPKFGQLIIRKIIRIVATKCQILGVKMYKIRFRLGFRPRPHLGSLQRSPDPMAAFKGLLLSASLTG